MEASDMTKTPTEASSPIGTSSSSPTSSSSTSPTTTTLSTCLSGHLSSILEKVNEMTNGKQGESKVLKILKGSLEKMRDEFATIEYKVESITDIAIEMLSKVDKKESGTAGEAAVKCPEDCNVKVAAILYEFLDLLAAEVVFGKVARIFTDIGHAFAKMKANCDQDFEQFDKMSKDELVFFNQGHEVKAIGKILEGIENRLLQVEKDEAQSDGLVADGVDPTNTPSPFGGSSSASTTTPSTATTVCPIMDVESDEKVEKLQDAENTAVVLLHRQLMVAEAKVVDLEQQLSLEKRDRMRQDQALQAQMKSLIDEQKIQNEKIRELTGTCDKLDVAALSQSETCRSVSGPLGQHDSMQLIPNEPIELPASSSTIQSLSHDQEESQNADLATMSNDEGGSDEVEITGESQDTNETKESTDAAAASRRGLEVAETHFRELTGSGSFRTGSGAVATGLTAGTSSEIGMGTQESRFRLLKPPAHLHHFFFHRELSCSLIFVPIDLDPRSGQKNVSIDKNSKSESLSVPLITLAQSSTRKLSRIHKMDVTNTTSTPSKTSSPTGTTSSSSSASTPSSSPTTTTLSSSWSGHLSSILAKVNDMTHEKHGESKVLETLKDSLEKMRDEFASIEYKVESITEIAIEMLSKVENKYQKPADSGVGSGIAGEAAVKCPENYNVEVAGILYEFLDVLAAEVVFGKAARIFTDVGHAFAEMKGNCDQDFEQFDKMSKDELVFFNQYHEVKAIGKILEGIENRLLQVEKDEAQSDGLIADGVDQSKTPSPFGGCSSESTTPTATTVCPILIRESDMNVATIKLKIESLESQMQYQSKALDIHGDNLKTLKSRCKRIESSFAAGLDAVMTDIDDLKSDYQFPKGLERTRKDLESCKNADDLKKLEGKIHTMVLRQDECNEKRIEIMTQFLEFKKMAYNWLTTEVESLFSGVEMKEAMAKFEERMEFPSEMSDGGAESDGLVDKDVNQSKNGEQHKALDPTNTTSPIESSSSATTTTTCPILDRESDETFENGQCPLEMSGSESAEQDCVDPCKDGKEPKEPESTA